MFPLLSPDAEAQGARAGLLRWRAVTRRLGLWLALAAVYFVAAKLGLQLAFVHPSATAVWAPTGLALAAFLLLGPGAWPAVFVAALAANLTTAGTLATSLGIALGNTLEGLLGAHLVERYAGGLRAFDHARHVFRFAALAAIGATTVSATIGVTSLALGGVARWIDFGTIWITWWLGDTTGALVLAPVLLLWSTDRRFPWTRTKAIEAALLLISVVAIDLAVFGGLFPSLFATSPLEILCVPVLVWAALRFGPRETATAILVLSALALGGTLRGNGPFVRSSAHESLLLLQAFMAVTAFTVLILASVVAERRRVEGQLRELSVRDPLTGLANYRRLTEALEGEIGRSWRTGRPFAVVFIDVDGLKTINDRHGHLVGSRALCRVAEAMGRSRRAVDTAARFGGDEFALVLPETDGPAALQVAARVRETLALDREDPPLSLSYGVAVFPRDGVTAESLLGAADGLLYGMKATAPQHRPTGTPLASRQSD